MYVDILAFDVYKLFRYENVILGYIFCGVYVMPVDGDVLHDELSVFSILSSNEAEISELFGLKIRFLLGHDNCA